MKCVIIGGGISGLATAFRLRQVFAGQGEPLDLRLLESEDRVGGKIRSESRQGYLMEWGPNGFLDSKPDTLELCRDLGLGDELLPSRGAAKKRFIFARGILHRVPERPWAFFRSPLLSIRGRLRIMKEPWAQATPEGLDTSIAEFGTRRLGREAMEMLLDPMVSGIFAGDPAAMSLASCFPRIAEMEAEHGSLLRAMVSLARERRRTAGRGLESGEGGTRSSSAEAVGGGPAGPGGTLTSLSGGLGRLVAALAEQLGDTVVTRVHVEKIRKDSASGSGGARYRILCRHQDVSREFEADAVVVAAPAYAASWMLAQLDPAVSRLLWQIPYAPVAVAGIGFNEGGSPGPLDGFGFLVPYGEGLPLLGSLWTSSIFPGRAPAGSRFTRNMLGGWRNPWILSRDDQEVQERILEVFEKALQARGQVEFLRVVRHAKAIPQYTLGHGRRLAEIEKRLERFPGLYVTGNAYRGVALNDCTREARSTARRVAADHVGRSGSRGETDAK